MRAEISSRRRAISPHHLPLPHLPLSAHSTTYVLSLASELRHSSPTVNNTDRELVLRIQFAIHNSSFDDTGGTSQNLVEKILHFKRHLKRTKMCRKCCNGVFIDLRKAFFFRGKFMNNSAR